MAKIRSLPHIGSGPAKRFQRSADPNLKHDGVTSCKKAARSSITSPFPAKPQLSPLQTLINILSDTPVVSTARELAFSTEEHEAIDIIGRLAMSGYMIVPIAEHFDGGRVTSNLFLSCEEARS